MTRAILIVDCQEDFVEGGSLAVQGGRDVCRRISDHLAEPTFAPYDLVIASRDWHKAWPDTNGGHFAEEPNFVDSWPPHCVAGEDGAEYAEELHLPPNTVMIFKGMGRPDYSAFQGVTESGERLETVVSNAHVTHLTVVGIASDFCVRASALDALRLPYNIDVTVRVDMIAGVDPTRSRKALSEIVALGGHLDWPSTWLTGAWRA